MTTIDALPRPKVAHTGVAAPPYGPTVCLVYRHDRKPISVHKTRHEALDALMGYHGDGLDDYEVIPVPVGAVPMMDVAHLARRRINA